MVQRVARAAVRVDGELFSQIGPGMLVLLGVAEGDTSAESARMARKLLRLRIFADEEGRMSEDLGERQMLCVSQFTLLGDTSKGNRPSFVSAARPETAEPLYLEVCELTGAARGVFGADMEVEMTGDGPVTVMLEA